MSYILHSSRVFEQLPVVVDGVCRSRPESLRHYPQISQPRRRRQYRSDIPARNWSKRRRSDPFFMPKRPRPHSARRPQHYQMIKVKSRGLDRAKDANLRRNRVQVRESRRHPPRGERLLPRFRGPDVRGPCPSFALRGGLSVAKSRVRIPSLRCSAPMSRNHDLTH